MTTNQNLGKNVSVIGFSICGVAGFQTVAAEGASKQKRIMSALNHMERQLKVLDKELIDGIAAIPVNEKGALSILNTRLAAARFAFRILSTVRDQAVIQQDQTHLIADDESVVTMTSEEFFKDANLIYAENVNHMIASAKEIDVGIDTHITTRKNSIVQKRMQDVVPFIYTCTGAFFGNSTFALIMSGRNIAELGNGDEVKAAHELCLRAIRSIKNFSLSDYLRMDTEKSREAVRVSILRMDSYIDQINDVMVTPLGTLMNIPHPGKNAQLRYGILAKITNPLELENEQRLMSHIMALGKSEDSAPDWSCGVELPVA